MRFRLDFLYIDKLFMNKISNNWLVDMVGCFANFIS